MITEDRALEENRESNANVAFHQVVMFHGAAMVPRLRNFSVAKRNILLQETIAISLVNPLYIAGSKKQFIVPSWGWQEPLSGAQVVALQVLGMWVHVGEREDLAASLLKDWPEILDAKKLGYLDPDPYR